LSQRKTQNSCPNLFEAQRKSEVARVENNGKQKQRNLIPSSYIIDSK
jgi:hypothetical protein